MPGRPPNDHLIEGGCNQFLDTLKKFDGTRAIIITVQTDGYVQVNTNVAEPELTSQLMRVAGARRRGDTTQ